MQTITIPQAKQAIQHVAVELREPVMLWGQPGAGKSEAVSQVTQDLAFGFIDIRLGDRDGIDLRGLPNIYDEIINDPEAMGRAVHKALTTWAQPCDLPFVGNPRFDPDAPGYILFLDEINSAPPATLAVAYRLINDRGIGEHRLMDNVYIVAAGNREGDRGVTTRMPTPLANRFTHYEIVVDTEAWTFYAQDKVAPIFIAFMQFRKNLLTTFDPAKPDKAFATPRTWMKAAKYFSHDMPADIKQASMAGAVGQGPSAEFWGFHDVWSKMIPISTIEKDPDGVELPREAAMRYAITVAVSGALTTKNLPALHKFLMRLDPEFVIMAWQLALSRDRTLAGTPEFIDVAKRFKAVFGRA